MAHRQAPRTVADRSIEKFESADLLREGTRVRGTLEMDASVHALGPVMLVTASGGPQEIERRPLLPGTPTVDFIYIEEGTFTYPVGRQWIVCEQPLMIAPSGLPQQVRFLTPWRFIVARIAKEALRPFAAMIPDDARVFDKLRLPERAMYGYLASVGHDAAAGAAESLTTSRLIVEMASAVLRDRAMPAFPERQHGADEIWSHALAVIVGECRRIDFDSNSLAQTVGCSLRRLQAEFAAHGTTVAVEIRRERARIAHSLLHDPQHRGLSISAIAAEAGFAASSTMYRVLGELYNVTPQRLRATL